MKYLHKTLPVYFIYQYISYLCPLTCEILCNPWLYVQNTVLVCLFKLLSSVTITTNSSITPPPIHPASLSSAAAAAAANKPKKTRAFAAIATQTSGNYRLLKICNIIINFLYNFSYNYIKLIHKLYNIINYYIIFS